MHCQSYTLTFFYLLFANTFIFHIAYNMPHRIGKINNIQKFDSQFFNISTMEAHVLDPMTRMLLEHTYEAIIDAGINPKELRGTRTSVFSAVSVSESRAHFFRNSQV